MKIEVSSETLVPVYRVVNTTVSCSDPDYPSETVCRDTVLGVAKSLQADRDNTANYTMPLFLSYPFQFIYHLSCLERH
jgi:hypothetical protein